MQALDQEAWRGGLRDKPAPARIDAGFIRRYDVSAANVRDSRHFEQVLDPANINRTVWTDGASGSAREADLKQRGYRPAIQHPVRARKPSGARKSAATVRSPRIG